MTHDSSADGSLLTVRGLQVAYRGRTFRPPTRVLHGVDLDVRAGEAVGLVGESGSGKSTLGRAVLGLAPVTGGSIVFDGEDISHASRARRRALAADIQVIFQDPYSSLSPSLTVGDTLSEPLRARGGTRGDSLRRVSELLDLVNLPADAARRLPREFSGGQRQRIAIARALALEPRLIICDEPVSALDLTTQERILDLLLEVQERTGVAYLFVSHDLNVVRAVCHRVAVMRGGEIVESSDGDAVTSAPAHPYTQRLLLAAPVADPVQQARRRQEYALVRDQDASLENLEDNR
ncbi:MULTISPECIES: ATP-binding cassette domain-containing protein [unclassified Microbacterium]|uniref:ATP-binding cassette domain-containing protein n=1 Tax=unclassified Microbacterium TaxID=2609290 RepID=UPI000EA89190|nr:MULTISPECIES: ATP-binding cassette domain-containing protein [unclassified Microbacterium]MBT2486491.1 ABC transporter ATP-binding protein [Microbacterium sp. ISL-108]RKN69188.1 ABC transporter ATP-binding protein [Microbacterium sp. CGR2]